MNSKTCFLGSSNTSISEVGNSDLHSSNLLSSKSNNVPTGGVNIACHDISQPAYEAINVFGQWDNFEAQMRGSFSIDYATNKTGQFFDSISNNTEQSFDSLLLDSVGLFQRQVVGDSLLDFPIRTFIQVTDTVSGMLVKEYFDGSYVDFNTTDIANSSEDIFSKIIFNQTIKPKVFLGPELERDQAQLYLDRKILGVKPSQSQILLSLCISDPLLSANMLTQELESQGRSATEIALAFETYGLGLSDQQIAEILTASKFGLTDVTKALGPTGLNWQDKRIVEALQTAGFERTEIAEGLWHLVQDPVNEVYGDHSQFESGLQRLVEVLRHHTGASAVEIATVLSSKSLSFEHADIAEALKASDFTYASIFSALKNGAGLSDMQVVETFGSMFKAWNMPYEQVVDIAANLSPSNNGKPLDSIHFASLIWRSGSATVTQLAQTLWNNEADYEEMGSVLNHLGIPLVEIAQAALEIQSSSGKHLGDVGAVLTLRSAAITEETIAKTMGLVFRKLQLSASEIFQRAQALYETNGEITNTKYYASVIWHAGKIDIQQLSRTLYELGLRDLGEMATVFSELGIQPQPEVYQSWYNLDFNPEDISKTLGIEQREIERNIWAELKGKNLVLEDKTYDMNSLKFPKINEQKAIDLKRFEDLVYKYRKNGNGKENERFDWVDDELYQVDRIFIRDTSVKLDELELLLQEENKVPTTGFDAVGLVPKDKHKGSLEPVLVIQGTEDLNDIFSDLSPTGVGFNQFEKNKELVTSWLSAVSSSGYLPPSITGHSLGGALSQMFGSHYVTQDNGELGHLITFQSAGINRRFIREFDQDKIKNVTHLTAHGDIISLIGDGFLPGQHRFYEWNTKDLSVLSVVPYIKDKHLSLLAERTPSQVFNTTDKLSSGLFSYWISDSSAARNDWGLLNATLGVLGTLISPLLPGVAAVPTLLTNRGTAEASRSLLFGSLVTALNILEGLTSDSPIAQTLINVGHAVDVLGDAALDKIATWNEDMWNAVSKWSPSLWTAIEVTGVPAISFLTIGGAKAAEALASGGIVATTYLIGGGVEAATALARGGIEAAEALIKGGAEAFEILVDGGENAVKALLKGDTKAVWSAISDGGEQAWDAIANGGKKAWNAIEHGAEDVWNDISKRGQQAWDAIEKGADQAWDAIANGTEQAWSSIKNAADDTWDIANDVSKKVWDIFKKTTNSVWDFSNQITDNIWNIVSSSPGQILNVVSKPKKIINTLSKPKKILKEGKKILKKLKFW